MGGEVTPSGAPPPCEEPAEDSSAEQTRDQEKSVTDPGAERFQIQERLHAIVGFEEFTDSERNVVEDEQKEPETKTLAVKPEAVISQYDDQPESDSQSGISELMQLLDAHGQSESEPQSGLEPPMVKSSAEVVRPCSAENSSANQNQTFFDISGGHAQHFNEKSTTTLAKDYSLCDLYDVKIDLVNAAFACDDSAESTSKDLGSAATNTASDACIGLQDEEEERSLDVADVAVGKTEELLKTLSEALQDSPTHSPTNRSLARLQKSCSRNYEPILATPRSGRLSPGCSPPGWGPGANRTNSKTGTKASSSKMKDEPVEQKLDDLEKRSNSLMKMLSNALADDDDDALQKIAGAPPMTKSRSILKETTPKSKESAQRKQATTGVTGFNLNF